jgi:acyl-coenzyme A synthetase/AMP-(fatty) acid ligase
MASGYLNHPGMFEARVDAGGFYHSGDRGRIVDGRLHLVGRTQDHINVAGRKIDPTEIVAVVTALDGVADAVAFPDEDLNREALVHLVVVAADRESGNELTKAAVAEACRSRLAPYKVPGRISFVDEIPRTGIGKPRIAVLREQLNTSA